MFGRLVVAAPKVPLTLALLGTSALASAVAAWAHAQLLGTSPASCATVATEPKDAIFKHNRAPAEVGPDAPLHDRAVALSRCRRTAITGRCPQSVLRRR